jgi:GNAT superfamily N-acetyltransferase
VKVKCFACPVILEAGDCDAVVEAFVLHGQDTHFWEYPGQAIRNYARNYCEAEERLTGSTDRLPEIGALVIHQATADRVDDWLQFFDHDGFAGNPDWASCYCLEPHIPATPEMPERAWQDVRAIMIERLQSGATHGYLAYTNNRVAGWVNASLRSDYGIYGPVEPDGPEPSSIIGVSCFVVAPPFRRHGIASALIDHVVADAAARSARWIEAYPHNEPEESDAGHFRGPRSMYVARGFMPIEIRERFTVMRRSVGSQA